MEALAAGCAHCQAVGAALDATVTLRYADHQLDDATLYGHTPNMAEIDTRTVDLGRYFTDVEDRHAAYVCLIGDRVLQEFFAGVESPGPAHPRRATPSSSSSARSRRIGSVLGQDQDNFLVVPLRTFLKVRGQRNSLNISVKAEGPQQTFELAQDDVRRILRARRHVAPGAEDDFYFGTADSYISLWKSISSAFFAVFVMISSISAVVGGIVIMNVMLVARHGAHQRDRRAARGGRDAIGYPAPVPHGKRAAVHVRRRDRRHDWLRLRARAAPVHQLPRGRARLGRGAGSDSSSVIGMFFGIYPAVKASKLDPVTALRTE